MGYFAFDRFLLAPKREASAVEAAREAGRTEATIGACGDRSIAVLPFEDLSPGGKEAYFADGIAEELLNLLAKYRNLRVVSRSSSFALRDAGLGIPDLGRQLHVSHILEGSVRRTGEHIRITAQLIEADTDTHLWSQTYDRGLEDILKIEDQIAAQRNRLAADDMLLTPAEVMARADSGFDPFAE